MKASQVRLWVAAAIVLCFATTATEAQQAARRPSRIGVLNAAWAATHPTVEGLKAGLKELGLQDGRDVTFDIRFTEGKLDAMPAAAEVVREESEKTPMARKVHASFTKFQQLVSPWDRVAEDAYHQLVSG